MARERYPLGISPPSPERLLANRERPEHVATLHWPRTNSWTGARCRDGYGTLGPLTSRHRRWLKSPSSMRSGRDKSRWGSGPLATFTSAIGWLGVSATYGRRSGWSF